MSDNGLWQIFCNCLNLDAILYTIEHLVCRKMCCKNFENRLPNKKSSVEKEFSVQKSPEGSEYFLAKIKNSC